MFPLYRKDFPATASELERQLNESLGCLFTTNADPVSLRATAYPAIEEMRVNLDGAALLSNPPRPPVINGAATPALNLESLVIRGSQINLGPAAVDLQLHAHGVRLSRATDAREEIILVLQSATDGSLEISAAKSAIEQAIAAIAKAEAGKQGVAIDQVTLNLRPRGDRGLEGEVRLRAKKLFLTTNIQISGTLDLDANLNATVSDARCSGEGAMGSIACSFLEPHLQKVNSRSVSLLALPLGEVQLRDVRLSANERLSVRAEFGS